MFGNGINLLFVNVNSTRVKSNDQIETKINNLHQQTYRNFYCQAFIKHLMEYTEITNVTPIKEGEQQYKLFSTTSD